VTATGNLDKGGEGRSLDLSGEQYRLREWTPDDRKRTSKRQIRKRSRKGEGRPRKRTPKVVATIAGAIATGLTDREAGLLAGIRHDTMTDWRKDPEFSEVIEKATAERLLLRLNRIEAGEQGWQGTAWALERILSSSVRKA
jgi:hypothetical protein